MKPAVTLLFLMAYLKVSAQHYQCLLPVTQFYENGYVRAIQIDSIVTNGNEVVFYPFHAPRGAYMLGGGYHQLDPSGGSWIGKKVIARPDGTTFFETYWNDTVVIKTQSDIGDSWIFYDDTSSRYYMATVTALDTATISGVPDSVKTITITAYANSSVNTGDLVHNLTIRLSQNHGFLEVFSLYMFPFHPADISTYQSGLDYLMDSRDVIQGTVKSYKILEFPFTQNDIYNYSTGDVWEYYLDAGPNTNPAWELDSVLAKSTTGNTTTYQLLKRSRHYVSNPGNPYTYTSSMATLTVSGKTIIDTSQIPEKDWNAFSYYIDRTDSSFCVKSPQITYSDKLATSLAFEPCGSVTVFKVNVGRILDWYCDDPSGPSGSYARMDYSRINNNPCGVYTPVTGINDISNRQLRCYPNPAKNRLYVNLDVSAHYKVFNLIGEKLLDGALDAQHSIDLSSLPNQAFILWLTDKDGQSLGYSYFVVAR